MLLITEASFFNKSEDTKINVNMQKLWLNKKVSKFHNLKYK
jgi:hypothetical protein